MGLIFIPKLTKKHLLFLGFSIAAFLRDFLTLIDYNDYITRGKVEENFRENIIQRRYFDIITNIIADCLQGIFVLFNKIKARREKSKSIENIDYYKDKNKEKDKNTTFASFIKIMLKICFVDFFCQFLFLLFCLIFKEDDAIPRKYNNYLLIIDILSRFIFCRFILDTYFYRHHIVSMIVNLIIFLILGSFDIYYIFNTISDIEKKNILIGYFFFLILQTIAYSLEDVLNKIALSKESLTPYSLLFYKGVLEIPLLIIISIIVLPFHNVFNYFSSLDRGFKKYVLIKRTIFIIFTILRSMFLVQVIDKFSSQHLSILKVLESIFMFLYFLIKKEYDKENESKIYVPVISISFIILVFTSLVYNEVIVINKFGMQDYTQHGLDEQAQKDLRDAISIASEMSFDVSETSSRKDSIVSNNDSINY